MHLIEHAYGFRQGTRVLFLKARWKDGVEEQRSIARITHDEDQHRAAVIELAAMARPGERIYGSVNARDVGKAAKYLKLAMIENDYAGGDQLEFYRRLSARWESALMQPSSRADKAWLWDCDEPGQYEAISAAFFEAMPQYSPYRYETVNGLHLITQPFDMRKVPPELHKLRDDNAMMLWGFWRKEANDHHGETALTA